MSGCHLPIFPIRVHRLLGVQASNVPIELGGKRGARVRAATADVGTANADYDDAVRQFRAVAADAFIGALSARDILQSKKKSQGEFDRIVRVNEERVRVGDIGDIELVQSRVNRDQFRADVITAQADVSVRTWPLGNSWAAPETLFAIASPRREAGIPDHTFNCRRLVATAFQQRPDVISKTRALKAADLRIDLARTNLIPDANFGGAYPTLGLVLVTFSSRQTTSSASDFR